MEKNDINMDLRIRIKEFLRFIWKEEKIQSDEEEKNLLNSLPQNLKNEFLLSSCGSLLLECPIFFQNFSKKCLNEAVFRGILKQIRFTPGDIIIDVILNFSKLL